MTSHEVASLHIGSKIRYQYYGITTAADEVDEGTVIGFGTYGSGETYADIDWYQKFPRREHIGIVQYSLQALLGEAFKFVTLINPVNLEEII